MGLLDDLGPLLRGKPKALPIDLAGPLKTPTFNGAPTKGPMDFGLSDLATAPPEASQQKSMAFALDDIAPSAQAPGAVTTPGGKIGTRLAEGNPVLPPTPEPAAPSPSLPTPGSGLLANAPLPPSRPAGLGGIPATRSAAAMPLPPPRPAGLGGAASIASTAAPPMPPPRPPGLGGTDVASAPPMPPPRPPEIGGGGLLAAKPPAIVPTAPPIAPPAPIAPPPEAKAPQIAPSNIGAEVSQTQAGAKAQVPQILQGLLAPAQNNTLDPRKRQRMA